MSSEHIYRLARMFAAISSQFRDESRVTYSPDEALAWMRIDSIASRVRELLDAEVYRARGIDTPAKGSINAT